MIKSVQTRDVVHLSAFMLMTCVFSFGWIKRVNEENSTIVMSIHSLWDTDTRYKVIANEYLTPSIHEYL